MKTQILLLVLTLAAFVASATVSSAQEPAATTGASSSQQNANEEADKKAFALLDQIVNEAQLLRLSENRIRIQIGVADLMWQQNEGRARSLFTLAADGVAEMMRSAEPTDQRRGSNNNRNSAQLRQELVLTAARHDAPLAYQLLAATRPLTPQTEANNTRRFDAEQNLEQNLLAQVAALDPKYALQNAEQLLDKGQYPRSLTEVLSRLQSKDQEAALRLEDKIVKKLRAENMLTNFEAGVLAMSLLQTGPRIGPDNVPTAVAAGSRSPLLAQSAYQDLLATLLDAALKANPSTVTGQRRTNIPRGRRANQDGNAQNTPPQITDAQNEQRIAIRLLSGFRSLLPQVDQYLPSRAAALRQKMTETGITTNRSVNRGQLAVTMQQATSDGMITAASTAPPGLQSRIYQQAAMKALEEGNPERARQIANDYLEDGRRQSVLQNIEFRQLASKTEANKIDEVRNSLASLPSDSARVELLVRLSEGSRKENPQQALELLNQAREFTNRRATGYEQFEMQLRVAAAYRDLESTRSFEILEPGIMQLNELLAAAAVLSGFEINVFREGEMPLQGGNRLGDMVRRYGSEIGRLSKSDFEQAQTLASRFQFAEARIVTRMAIARSLLGLEPGPTSNFRRAAAPFIDGINRRSQ